MPQASVLLFLLALATLASCLREFAKGRSADACAIDVIRIAGTEAKFATRLICRGMRETCVLSVLRAHFKNHSADAVCPAVLSGSEQVAFPVEREIGIGSRSVEEVESVQDFIRPAPIGLPS